MPERFGRFDMPGLRFWSHCPPAGMGFRLPVGGFCPRNWGPLSLWGHLTIPSDGESIYFTRSISLNSQLNLLLAALLFFCCSFQPFQYSCCPCSLLPPPRNPGAAGITSLMAISWGCAVSLRCLALKKKNRNSKSMERAGGGVANTWTSLLKVRLSWPQKRG